MIKVVIYGEANSYGTGAWCYREAFLGQGFEVLVYDSATGLDSYLTKFWWRIHRRLGGVIPDWIRRAHVLPFLKLCKESVPNVVMVLKGLYLDERDIARIKATGAWVINVNHDDFFSKNRNNWSVIQRSALPVYNYIFTTREVNVDEVLPFNANVEFFPFAYNPSIHHICCPEAELGAEVDVLFIGTHEESRAVLMEKLVESLPITLEIYGGGWERLRLNSSLKARVKGAGLWGEDMARAIGAAKVSLGFLRKENRDEYTQRSFEIPVCGGLFLAERTAAHQRFFIEGVEADFFNADSADELIAKVKALLGDKARRESMRVAGRAAVMRQKHTYEDRIRRLMELYKQWKEV